MTRTGVFTKTLSPNVPLVVRLSPHGRGLLFGESMARDYYIPYAMISSGAIAAMSPSASKLFLALCAHDGPNGIFPTRPTLARECDFDLRTVDDATIVLERLKLIEVTRSRKGNTYRLLTLSEVASSVAATDVGTSSVATSNAPSVGTSDAPSVVASNAPQTLSRENTKQEHEEEGGPVAPHPACSPQSPGGEPGPKAPATAPSTKSKEPKAVKREAMTDEDLRLILSDSNVMAGYFLYGRPALRADAASLATLPPSQTHWAPASRNQAAPEAGCSLPAFAAYCWVILQQARAKLGLPLAMPAMGRLIGTMKALAEKMPRDQVVNHLWRVCQHWPAIQGSLGNFGASLALDEGILSNPQVMAASERITSGQNLAASPGRPAPAAKPITGGRVYDQF